MKYLIASLGVGAILSGCMSSPSEFYGIRQAVPERDSGKYASAPLHTAPASIASTSHAVTSGTGAK